MRSFRTKISDRRRTFLSLASQIEGQLREAYDREYKAGRATQSSLGERLGVNRSAINRRLTGRTNMTIETIADMVWALGQRVRVSIYDPRVDQDGARFPQSAEQSNEVLDFVRDKPAYADTNAPPAPVAA